MVTNRTEFCCTAHFPPLTLLRLRALRSGHWRILFNRLQACAIDWPECQPILLRLVLFRNSTANWGRVLKLFSKHTNWSCLEGGRLAWRTDDWSINQSPHNASTQIWKNRWLYGLIAWLGFESPNVYARCFTFGLCQPSASLTVISYDKPTPISIFYVSVGI